MVAATRIGPKRSVHFSSDSRSENTLLPFPTHDNHGLQGSIMLVSQVDEGNAIGRDREAIFLEDVEDEIEALDPVDTCLGRRTSFGGLLAPLVRTVRATARRAHARRASRGSPQPHLRYQGHDEITADTTHQITPHSPRDSAQCQCQTLPWGKARDRFCRLRFGSGSLDIKARGTG